MHKKRNKHNKNFSIKKNIIKQDRFIDQLYFAVFHESKNLTELYIYSDFLGIINKSSPSIYATLVGTF